MNPFPLLDTVAPAIGARLAERLWFAPPSGARPGAEPESVGTDFTFAAVDTTIAGRSWGEPGSPRALLMHGWGGMKEQMNAFVDPLVAAGFEVVAIDGPSHGASGAGRQGPKQTTFVEFIEALATLQDQFGPFDTVVAHSGGAMATVGALERGDLAADRLVLIAPFTAVEPFVRVFAAQAGFGERTRSRMQRRLERRIGSSLSEWDLATKAPQFEGAPLLVVHDKGDSQTPVRASAELVEAWPGAELMVTEGLGHNKILGDPAVVAAATQFATRVSEVL